MLPGPVTASSLSTATNEYNFSKLEKPPAFEPTLCTKCKKRINLGEDGYSIKGRDYFCERCGPTLRLG